MDRKKLHYKGFVFSKFSSLSIAVLFGAMFFGACNPVDTVKEPEKKIDHSSPEVFPENLKTLPGFEVELLYEVPLDTQGTWVRLAQNDQGRFVASDQYDKGMFWIDIVENEEGNSRVKVQKMNHSISGAQGLTWFKGSLYANMRGEGLYRMSDTEGDGMLDEVIFLEGPQVPSEHGNHALVPMSDGSGMYVVNGNHTPPPVNYNSQVSNWAEDILLPRQWDAQGHAAGMMAPGGYVATADENAENWNMVSVGYRNQYDLAIHPNGELFTFDSDMEWDLGMPWYRPTRVLHVVSGSDYGWRSGSGKWKAFYEDSHPSVLDVGPASPTGVLFGTGARFPEKYQKALFGLDWTYGIIYAFHLEPNGASYSATAEEFLSGQPLAVVDALIGKDGALYFITGGWSNETKLYRVTYTGSESTAPASYVEDSDAQLSRALRHRLEAYHGTEDPDAVAAAWPHLASEDRFIRNAARIAIEFQPVAHWIDRARTELRPQAVITSTVALARANDPSYKDDALGMLMGLDFSAMETMEKLGYLRALALTFMRLGVPDQKNCLYLANSLMRALPDKDERVNVEIVRLLVYLEDGRVIEPALELIQNSKKPEPPDWGNIIKRNSNYGGTIQQMLDRPPPINKLEYLFMLRNLKKGWSIGQYKTYFNEINKAADAMGGQSYWGFLGRMRANALQGVSDSVRLALKEIISAPIAKGPPFEVLPVTGPGKEWTVENALEVLDAPDQTKDFELGRNAYFAVGCASCHRFDGIGGNIGPDLGSVGNRFSTRKILEDIIHPSQTISDLYGASRVTLTSGRVLEGLVVKEGDVVKVYSRTPEQSPHIILSNEVESIEPVPVSQMPPGLINPLNADELRSLIAYLQSGGNPDHTVFKSK
ncbi:c-type cytochrome [Membranicola marinus]|uniref:C-type cytochrome n=1 Tax=Membranihabitans marinus TaxID=1227546 RepID=A0A953HP05_9BACT|nr:c-type cytochrome [Membranihabitans marinus]MBY5959529.1 c-type cytochrome [Membranihabitans marinus]